MFRKFAPLAVLVLATSICCIAATVGLPIREGLFSKDTNEQRMAIGTIRRQHTENVDLLIKFVGQKDGDNSWEGVRHLAIRLLGDLRATEAVPVLTEHLTFLPVDIFETEALPSEFYYPCAVALVDIGGPSIASMVYSIERSKDATSRNLAAWVLMRIEGSEQAAQRLQNLTDESFDDRVKQRLQAARTFILTYKPVDGSPRSRSVPINLIPRESKADK